MIFGAGPAPRAWALDASRSALRIEDRSAGNLLLGADQARIGPEERYRTVLLLWGQLEVAGEIDEMVILSGRVTFTAGSRVKESLVLMGGSFDAQPGADVDLNKLKLRSPGPLWSLLRAAGGLWRENIGWLAGLVGSLSVVAILWLLGWALFSWSPRIQGITAGRLSREWPRNFLAGLLGAVLVPAIGVLLVISILGLLLLPVYFLLLFLAGLVSYLGAALWAGQRLLPPRNGRRFSRRGLLAGLVILQLSWVIGGWGILLVLALWMLAWGGLLRGLRMVF